MRNKKLLWAALVIIFSLSGCKVKKEVPEEKRGMDSGWYFRLDEAEDTIGSLAGASTWKRVDLPHDWSIESLVNQSEGITCGPFTRHSVGGKSTGNTAGGVGWYARTFTIPAGEKNKLHALYFEGAYMETKVWVNGKEVGYHPNGYTSFFCDIPAQCLLPDKVNVLVVRVANLGRNSRWYSGSGIYRHVWMVTTDKLHLKDWSNVIVTTALTADSAHLKLSSTLYNKYDTLQQATLAVRILSPQGRQVVAVDRDFTLHSGEEREVSFPLTVAHPQLWSTDTPVMYKAILSVLNSEGEMVCRNEIPFGIRSLDFSASKGMLLNGQPIKLKGGCIHHDNGFLGAAAIDRAEVRKVELLKANGYNAVRCAHNPPSEAFLTACDTLGLLVIDEAFDQWRKPKNPNDYHRFFDKCAGRDISSMVRRDRNHPSVIMWSIGNEIQERSDSSGVDIARYLKSVVLSYDTTRPVTAAVNDYWDNPGLSWKTDSEKAFSTLDICGYNYMWREYENDHRKFPQRIMFGSESTAGEAAVNWDLVEKHPFIIGDFVWTALDYLGEAGIAHALSLKSEEVNPQFLEWPWFNAWCGDIDLCGDKKPQSYYRDVVWRRTPVAICVHTPVKEGLKEKVSYWGWVDEYPSWSWNGYENQAMKVNVYSRACLVRLYLNGKLLGEQPVGTVNKYTASFNVRYQSGKLKAVNVVNGKETDAIVLRTSGKPYALKLTADRTSLAASPNDLSYVHIAVTDKEGNIIADSNAKVLLSVSGEGTIAGSGNASPTDMESFRSLTPRVYKGKALVILRPKGGASGEIVLTVASPGLQQATFRITVNKSL
ncbi:glycoside hydrolase family 2 TIM barrel-domain containing protein [uncultured Bacteroides sp.]|uniref:glycoside hydrolase family 2 TIM barrel-domain containing protein n=1 Tax=uncultured Bacteroides sp. TaxID=162156 RepID=UPI002AA762BC|nr:glycoside hydrolase family 2 TIM barrel-domain containing protein [uncultured Bacteroides sp.]